MIIVDKVDRFYRHLGGLLTTLDQLNSYGVSLASVQERIDFTTPWGKLMLSVLGTLAEIYLDNLRQEVRKGKLQRARQGLWLGGTPFGYCNGLCSKCTDYQMDKDIVQTLARQIKGMAKCLFLIP